jgi:hypothetical protein
MIAEKEIILTYLLQLLTEEAYYIGFALKEGTLVFAKMIHRKPRAFFYGPRSLPAIEEHDHGTPSSWI